MNKKCNACGETKPIEEFTKDARNSDGRGGQCKKCRNAIVEKWRQANPNAGKKRNKKWRDTRPDRVKELAKKYWSYNKHSTKWRQNNPDKYACHIAVQIAVAKGNLAGQPCEVCGDTKVHAHHDDYSKPLEVRWLCSKHHMEHHANVS